MMADPEVVINDNGESAANTSNAWKEQWQRYPNLSAVKNQALYSINPDWLERAGPRLTMGAEKMCNLLYNINKKPNIRHPATPARAQNQVQ